MRELSRRGSSTLCPGSDYLSCHGPGGRVDSDKHWTIAGTVFSSPTDPVTAGVSGVAVSGTDAVGQRVTLTTNSVGTF